MVSGERLIPKGGRGPFWEMQREFSRWFGRVDVLCPKPDGPVVCTSIHDNVHFHPADTGRFGMSRYIVRRGAELIEAHGHGLITSHDYGTFYNGIGSARLSAKTGVPYVSEIHHVPGLPLAIGMRERFEHWMVRRYVRWARHRTRAFRVVNEGQMVPYLSALGVPREKIEVLHSLYLDLETFHPPTTPVQRRWDLVYAGRFVGNKGLDRMVDAIAKLRRDGRDTTLLLNGDGPMRSELESKVRAVGVDDLVTIRGWVDTVQELADAYRASGAVLCASTCEGGPRVTVEAMACGVPAISTPVGMMPELLEGGELGVLVGFDVDSLAAGIRSVLDDEDQREEMGRRAAEYVRRFEYATILEGYARGIYRLAGVEAPPAPGVPG